MDDVAQAIADPIRRAILVMLHEAPRNAGVIADAFDVSRPAISRHLRVLREAGLVRDTVTGRERKYALDASPLTALEEFIERLRAPNVWSRRFDALETEVHRVKRSRKLQKEEQRDGDEEKRDRESSERNRKNSKERKAI